jgi:hypothetical protein
MNRNQKIGIGCGAAGCLGLIVVIIVGVAIYFLRYTPARASRSTSPYNYNFNSNSNSNKETNARADNDNESSSSSSSSMADDDKHKLFQAASVTGDPELVHRAGVKIGVLNEDFTPGDDYVGFLQSHVGWAMRNIDFINSIDTPAKARAYVKAHIGE